MRLEIESAANFLLNFLRLQPNCLTGDQLEIFRETINKLLTNHYQQHWFPEKPVRGSGYRCLRINHKMDPIIAKAGSCCGLNEKVLRGYLPKELTLWVDPKEVSYRIGENGSICVLFNGDSDKSTINNDSQNSGITKVQHQQQQFNRTKVSSPVRSLSPLSSSSSFSSSASSSLSNSPTSSLDWSHTINTENRRSPITRNNNNQMASPPSVRSVAASLPSSPASNTTGSDVTGFGRSGFSLYDVDVVTAHQQHRQQQQQQQRQGRNIVERNNWNWTSSSYVNGYHQQQAQQQQHFHYGRQHSPLHGRNPSPPLSHNNFTGWNNYALDHTLNYRNHRFNAINANIEQLATYVSS